MQADDKVTRIKRAPAKPPERLPSANVSIEIKLLGALVEDSQLMPLIRRRLTFPGSTRVRPFYSEAHQTIYDEMCRLYDTGQVPEYETLFDALESTGRLEQVGRDTLNDLLTRPMADTSLHLTAEIRERVLLQWADILRNHALRRAAYDLSTGFAGIAYPDPATAQTSPAQDYALLQTKVNELTLGSLSGTSRYQLLTVSELLKLPDQDYLISSVLPQDSISMTYGESGSGKSFLTIDMGLCVAAGIPWHGHETKQGAVVYIAAEGGRGIKRRVDAWLAHHQCPPEVPFYVIDRAVPLLQPESVHELLTTLDMMDDPAALIFIDTLARSMDGGDENAAKDVNTVTAAADRIRQLHGAHVGIVHHSGKDGSRGARGSSALRGNVDTEIMVSKDQNTITVKCEKQKDDEAFTPMTLTVRRVALDEYATQTSLVLVDSPNAPTPPPVRLIASRQKALNALLTFSNGASASEWGQVSGLNERTFYRAIDELMKNSLVVKTVEGERTFYKLTEYGIKTTDTDI